MKIISNCQKRHPTPSGVTCVPSLVKIATSHRVGGRRRILVSRGLVTARCTCVKLADTMAMSPTVVPRKGFVGHSRCVCVCSKVLRTHTVRSPSLTH